MSWRTPPFALVRLPQVVRQHNRAALFGSNLVQQIHIGADLTLTQVSWPPNSDTIESIRT